MQTRFGMESDTLARRLRAMLALAVSLALHCGIAYAMLDAASVYGRANVPVQSLSAETVLTIVLDDVTPTDSKEPPAESAASQASVAAPTPTPEQQVPETQVEKTEQPAAAEPSREAAYQAPPTPTPLVETKPAVAASEPPVAAPPLPTVDQSAATEVPIDKPDPEAILEEQRRAAAEREQKQEEAQQQAERERKREADQREEARRIAEAEARRREVEEADRKRKKAEQEVAQKRLAEEEDRKRKSAQQAREAKKAKGAEHDQRASNASRGQKDARGSARTTASRGDILSYAALVRSRVASNKHGGSTSGGTAVVSFGVSGSGGLTYARISRSSGQSGLDQAALAAVRRSSPFPAPPDGQSHSFAVPFHFN